VPRLLASATLEELHARLEHLEAENAALRAELSHMCQRAERDALTNLWNRRHFDERLRYEWSRAEGSWAPLSLIVIGVDGLRGLAESGGERAARGVMARLGRVLGSVAREIDIPCRIGRDSLAVILPGTGRMAAEVEVDRLSRELALLFVTHGAEACAGDAIAAPDIELALAFGMAVAFDEAETALELLLLADELMLIDKRGAQSHRRSVGDAPTTPHPAHPTWIDAA
jgi:diguanylate cyclase (GGDEF)-like protein